MVQFLLPRQSVGVTDEALRHVKKDAALNIRPGDGPLRSVAYLAPGWPPGSVPNGIVSYIGKMRPAIQAEGVRVQVLAMSVMEGAAEPDVIDLASLSGPPGVLPMHWRLIRRFAPDYAHACAVRNKICDAIRGIGTEQQPELLQMEESFGWARRVRRSLSIPVVVRLHGPWFMTGAMLGRGGERASRRRIQLEGKAIFEANGVTAPSRDVLEKTRAYYGFPLENARVIPNPQSVVPDGEQWCLEGSDPHTVLFVGRFDRVKGGDLLLRAFEHVLDSLPEARLVFAGPDSGYLDEKGRMWKLQEYVQAHLEKAARPGRIDWLGAQPHAALAALRRAARVTVVSSRYETFGNVATEAMAAGCPLVVPQVGGLAEIVEDDRNGLFFPAGDAMALAACIVRILSNGELAGRLGNQALRDCTERHDPGRLARETLAFYESVRVRWRSSNCERC